MLYRLRHPVGLLAAMLIVGILAVPSLAAGSSNDPGKRPGQAGPAGHSSVVHDCTYWTRATRFAAVRVKKVRKRVANGQLPEWKLKASIRIYHAVLRQKNATCSSPSGTTGPSGAAGAERPGSGGSSVLTSSDLLQ